MIKIEDKFISEGIELKKYISSGNKEILKIVLSSWRKFSTYNENTTPKIIPKIVAVVPIKNPTRKKTFIMDLFNTPIDFKIAISLVLFLTSIVKPEMILNAATIIIRDSIINITLRSIFKADNKDRFISSHVV